MTLIQAVNISSPSLTHSYLLLLSSHALSISPVCSSQSPNSFSPPAAPLWGAEVVFVRWVLLMSGLLNRCSDRKSPVVVARRLGKQTHQRSMLQCCTHTLTHTHRHTHMHSPIRCTFKDIWHLSSEEYECEMEFKMAGGTHKAALQWWRDMHTRTHTCEHARY